MNKILSYFAATLWLAAFSPMGSAADYNDTSLAVEFTGCVESIGVDLIATEKARALVPADFVLAGEDEPVTPIVVRTANCNGIAVDGHPPKAGKVVQIGVVIVPPDFTGDINNYTLWYYTSHNKLAKRLREFGIDAQHVGNIKYPLGDGSPRPFYVAIPKPGNPSFWIEGTVSVPANPASFNANWWVKVNGGSVKMATQVPEILIGGADLTLMTHPAGPLGELIGGSSMSFPELQQFNTFPGADMDVSVVGSP